MQECTELGSQRYHQINWVIHLCTKLLFLQTSVCFATHQYLCACTRKICMYTLKCLTMTAGSLASEHHRYQKYIKKLNSLPVFVKYRPLKLPPFVSHTFTTQSPVRQANAEQVHWLHYPTAKDEHIRKFNSSLFFKMSFPSLSVVRAKKGRAF